MKISTQIFLAFLIVLILSTIDTVSNYLLSLKVEKNIVFLSNSQDVMRNSTRLHKSIIEMQNSFRGFLLTGQSDFLENYIDGQVRLGPLFKDQERRIAPHKEQLAVMKSIEGLHTKWVAYADLLIVAKKSAMARGSSGMYDFLFEKRLKEKVGENLNDSITKKFMDFDRMEYKRRKIHSGNLIASIRKTHSMSFILLGLTIVVGITSTVYIMRLIAMRIQAMSLQAMRIAQGQFTVVPDTRKDELSGLSESLNAMSGILSKNINELEKRNAELDKFAYVVSHDLKAPLRGIHNVVQWIEEDLQGEISAKMKEYLQIIPQRTKRMEDLINGLLDYARTRHVQTPEETDVEQLVKEIAEAVVPPDFTLKTNRLPVFVTDKLRLEQVLTNLINNAVKYTGQSKGVITVSCREKKGYYEFCVKDNGIGIAAEYHSRIFEIFQTLRNKDEKESTGIGLAVVKKIIDDRHGTIKINSALGKGSEFVFTWPVENLS